MDIPSSEYDFGYEELLLLDSYYTSSFFSCPAGNSSHLSPPRFTNDDLETAKEIYKPLMPQGDDALDKTLVQGGPDRAVFTRDFGRHWDFSRGYRGKRIDLENGWKMDLWMWPIYR